MSIFKEVGQNVIVFLLSTIVIVSIIILLLYLFFKYLIPMIPIKEIVLNTIKEAIIK